MAEVALTVEVNVGMDDDDLSFGGDFGLDGWKPWFMDFPSVAWPSAAGSTEAVMTSDTSPSAETDVKTGSQCNCKRSKCLKKYCECFRRGVICSPECRCSGCDNTTSDNRRLAQSRAEFLNPTKPLVCACTKPCDTRYCPCRRAGRACSTKCQRCTHKNCNNFHVDSDRLSKTKTRKVHASTTHLNAYLGIS
jgi:hypothetical protein